jgi:hypothetical protein
LLISHEVNSFIFLKNFGSKNMTDVQVVYVEAVQGSSQVQNELQSQFQDMYDSGYTLVQYSCTINTINHIEHWAIFTK